MYRRCWRRSARRHGLGWALKVHHSVFGCAAAAVRAGLPVRMIGLACSLAIGCVLDGVAPHEAAAQVPFALFQPARQIEPVKPLARDVTGPPTVSQRLDGTAFFVDDLGHTLTARHAVADCVRIVVSKEGRSVTARLVALAATDIALIKRSANARPCSGIPARDCVGSQRHGVRRGL